VRRISRQSLEGEFSEVRRHGVLRSSPRIGSPFARRWVAWDTGPFALCYQGEHASRLGENKRGGTHERSAG
jgi:hypothetical protein